MTDFPLCKAAGLVVFGAGLTPKVYAEDVESLLSSAPVVMAYKGPANPEGVWIAKPYQDADSTHTARLLMIQPIAPPEREEIRLLREFVKDWKDPSISMKHICQDAEAFLARLDGSGK